MASAFQSDAFQNDAFQTETNLSFTADAVLLKTVSGSFTGNAVFAVLLFSDDFNNRTTSNEPGTPSGGGHYQLTNPNLDDPYEVAGGVLAVPSGDQEYAQADLWWAPASSDVQFYVDIFTATGAGYHFGASSHYDSGLNKYFTGEFDVYDTGAGWEIDSVPATLSGSTWYRIRADIDASVGHTRKIKIWNRSLSQPDTWLIEDTIPQETNHKTARLNVSWFDDSESPDPAQIDNILVFQQGGSVYDFFSADALLLRVISGSFTGDAWFAGAGEGTFTGDAILEAPHVDATFLADAYLVSTTPGSITGNAKLVNTRSDTFVADAFLRVVQSQTFTGKAVLFKPQDSAPRLKKNVSLHILDHRERPLPTYLPPKIPDEKEVPEQFSGPPCLPPCPGAGAGYGTGYGVNGGATVYTITHCTSGSCPERYFNSGDGYLGQGPVGTGTHCNCDTAHSQSAHVSRLWIAYTTIPDTPFRMRAKMIWDVGAPPNATVNVYANSSVPAVALGECDASGTYWDNGNLIGNIPFSADGNGSIAGRSVWFQTEASSLSIDPGAISTNTFRFEISDEGQYYRAEFKATTADIVTD